MGADGMPAGSETQTDHRQRSIRTARPQGVSIGGEATLKPAFS